MATKAEMEALYQQNSVLERDIHTCNYERINLTKQLHEYRERLDNLNYEINKQRIEKEQRARKSLFPVLSKDSSSMAGSGPIKVMTQLKQLGSNRSANSQSSNNRPASKAQQERSQESQELNAGYDPQDRRSISNPMSLKKKSKKFAFINGKLEARFNVKKSSQL